VNNLSAAATPAFPASRTAGLSPAAAFYLLASITVTFLAGSSAPTPLYALYQAQWGFNSTTITVIFGIYALAVLAALLVTGRLSDHVGRKPVLVVAVVAQVIAMVIFATATGLAELIAARVIQGLSTGAAVGAVGAGMLDIDRKRGTIANAVAPPIGTALGALLAGLLVTYLPAPTHLVYVVLGMVITAQGVGVLMMAEPNPPRPGAWASLKPQLALSPAVRGPMLLAIPALVATWALAGFYAALGPSLLRGLLGFSSALLGGLALFVLAASAAVSILALRNQTPRVLATFGASALLLGVAATILALSLHSAAAYFIGTAIAGAGFGAGFQGAIRTLATRAEPRERAGVLSIAFIVSYLAMGLPAIVAGYFVTRQGDIVATAREFALVVMVLAAFALMGALRKPKAA
jgi:MFS family permease